VVRILVLGKSGQLAQALTRASPPDATISALGREALDLAGPESALSAALRRFAPALVINAAAYTAVDRAESEPDAAFALNRDGPAALARLCADLDVPLIHVSTDYVFDGSKAGPYREDDARAPLNVYGASKASGEDAVLTASARATVVRTSWVFGSRGENFVKTMLRLAQTRDEIGVVHDQVGRPTSADDLATALLTCGFALLDRERAAAGVFHFAGADDASWADLADATFAGAATRGMRTAVVKKIPSAAYKTVAQRPLNSRLDSRKFTAAFGVEPTPWRSALHRTLAELDAGADL
jgi:dTDP-4-dehydrorhamnose reductase